MPRQTPQHRILPVGKIKACEQVLHPHLPALFSLPLSRPLGSPTWLGWGEARSTASRARILQGTWVLLTMWRPQQGAPNHCRHRACGPAHPWAPHLIHIPLPRASSLCRPPRWQINICRWPVGHLEANRSSWVCEKAHKCEHLALPQGSSQKTVGTETVFAALIEAYELQNSLLGGIEYMGQVCP